MKFFLYYLFCSNEEGVAELELGQLDVLKVRVSLENTGEVAYQAAFFMTNPLGLKFQKSIPVRESCNSSLL